MMLKIYLNILLFLKTTKFYEDIFRTTNDDENEELEYLYDEDNE